MLYPAGPIAWSFLLRLEPTAGRQLLQLSARLHAEVDRNPSLTTRELVCNLAFASWLTIAIVAVLCLVLGARSVALTIVRLRWLDRAAADADADEELETVSPSPTPSTLGIASPASDTANMRAPWLAATGRSRTDESAEAARALLSKVAGGPKRAQLHRMQSRSRLSRRDIADRAGAAAARDLEGGCGDAEACGLGTALSDAVGSPVDGTGAAALAGARHVAPQPPPAPQPSPASPAFGLVSPFAALAFTLRARADAPPVAPALPATSPPGAAAVPHAHVADGAAERARTQRSSAMLAPRAALPAAARDASAAEWRHLGFLSRLFTLLSAHTLVLVFGSGCLLAAATLHLRAQLRIDPSIDLIDRGWPSLATALGIASLWLSLTRYFEWVPALYTFTHTLRRAARNSLTLMAAVLPVFFAYALAGTVLFSDSTGNFSGFSTSCVTLWAMCVGDEVNENFRQVYAARPIIGRLYIYSFTAFFYLICANIFVFLIEAAHYAALRDILAASGSPWAQRLLNRSGLRDAFADDGGAATLLSTTVPHGELEHHRMLDHPSCGGALRGVDDFRAPPRADNAADAIARVERVVLSQQRMLLELLQAQRAPAAPAEPAGRGACLTRT